MQQQYIIIDAFIISATKSVRSRKCEIPTRLRHPSNVRTADDIQDRVAHIQYMSIANFQKLL